MAFILSFKNPKQLFPCPQTLSQSGLSLISKGPIDGDDDGDGNDINSRSLKKAEKSLQPSR
jgi:hypothetical protein